MVDDVISYYAFDEININLEEGVIFDNNGTSQARFITEQNGVPVGQKVEGSVAAALWDIKDTAIDTMKDVKNGIEQDTLAEGNDEIIAVYRSHPGTFQEFNDAWNTNNPLNSAFWIMNLHGMDFATNIGTSPTVLFTDNFQFSFTKWALSGDSAWSVGTPTERNPFENSRTNKVLKASNCDAYCNATTTSVFDTSDPLTVAFDRFVSDDVDGDEGLYVEYSTDGLDWTELGSFTESNLRNSDDWRTEFLDLDISSDTALVRFVAKSSQPNEHVEIDNVSVSPPDTYITFVAQVNDIGTKITMTLSRSVSAVFAPSDFTLSEGSITSITSPADSDTMHMDVEDIPYDTAVTVTYVGDETDFGSGVTGKIRTGTSSPTNSVSRPIDTAPVISSISDITVFYPRTSTVPVTANDAQGDSIVLSLTVSPRFVSFVDSGNGRGTITLSPTSADVGVHNVSVKATANQKSDIETFRITVSAPADTTPPMIDAPADMSFTTTETSIILTEADYGTANATDDTDPSPMITNNATNPFMIGDTTILWTATDEALNSATDTQLITVIQSSLRITAPPDVTAEATGPLTEVDMGNATATHDTDTDLTIWNNATSSFPLGNTTVAWTVRDSSGVTATAIQRVTVQDTTPPAFDSVPADIGKTVTRTSTDGVLSDASIEVEFDTPPATDLVDSDVGVECSPQSGSTFEAGQTIVTCTAGRRSFQFGHDYIHRVSRGVRRRTVPARSAGGQGDRLRGGADVVPAICGITHGLPGAARFRLRHVRAGQRHAGSGRPVRGPHGVAERVIRVPGEGGD